MEKEEISQQDERPLIIERSVSGCIDRKLEEAIGRMGLIVITGKPLIRWGEPPTYYNDNDVEIGVLLRVSYFRMMHIPQVGHGHLEHDFTGEYPAVSGFDVETGVEYLFGVKPELGFDYSVPPTAEAAWSNCLNPNGA